MVTEEGRGGSEMGQGGRSFGARFAGAFMFDASVYEEVERDPNALAQAAAVIVLGGLARGIGAFPQDGFAGLVASAVLAPVFWLTASLVVFGIGVRIFELSVEYPRLLRGLGFAAAPLVLLVLGVLPMTGLWVVVQIVAHGLAAIALVIAVRQALGVDTVRAVAVCVFAVAVALALVMVLGILFVGTALSG